MLIQFNFKNFKSFKDETTLDMTATSITEHPYNLIESENDKYIKSAAPPNLIFIYLWLVFWLTLLSPPTLPRFTPVVL